MSNWKALSKRPQIQRRIQNPVGVNLSVGSSPTFGTRQMKRVKALPLNRRRINPWLPSHPSPKSFDLESDRL